ncbi:MAG: DUF4886 domain-containing protein [Clostridia bacterium]|nr:DUF4886 domain-containing protein [Clostridia bacterium]
MNNTKKAFSLILCLVIAFAFVGCSIGDNTVTSETEVSLTQTEAKESTTAQPVFQQEPLKILSVGNSLSRDGMHYLPQLLEEAGYTDFVVAYLYVGGCSLEEHVKNAKGNRKVYDYFENTGNGWGCKENVSLKYGLGAHKWDYVVLQQASRLSGISSSYKYLDELISVVGNNKQDNPQLLWHMTWAYESGSDLDLFKKYDYDRHKMHRQTVSCIKEHILTNESIKGVIPVGAAVESYRNAAPDSSVTKDGRHMTKPLGRYLAGLVWFGYLTEYDIDSVKFNPDKEILTEKTVTVIKESVKSALENPIE